MFHNYIYVVMSICLLLYIFFCFITFIVLFVTIFSLLNVKDVITSIVHDLKHL